MKRTVRLAALPLNRGKYGELYSVVGHYTNAKSVFVARLRQISLWGLLDRSKSFRDYAKTHGLYPAGINVHLIDQAAFDAVDTCIRHIESCLAIGNIKAKIWRRFTDENERHYAYACLARYSAIGQIMGGGVPEISTVTTSLDARVKIAAYLHRVSRAVSSEMHSAAVGQRLLSLALCLWTRLCTLWLTATLLKAKPDAMSRSLAQPLTSASHYRCLGSGNIRVVLDEEHKRAFIHVIYDVARLPKATGPAIALDWGITEVCTDSSGVHNGNEYGRALTSMTERRTKTDKARNRLHALSKRDAGSRRTKHIARNNLGTKKQQARLRRAKAQLQTISGATIKEVIHGDGNRTRARKRVPQLPSQRPREIIIEDLSHLQGKV
ncbi:MAG: hypothetical protein M1447_05255 [Gammaproteobacteria bacterium]|nr:hypothetical protein [Gammaproteobacteria bacterium]